MFSVRDYSTDGFQLAHEWMLRKLNRGMTWAGLMLCGKTSEDACQDFLDGREEDDDWPRLSVAEWQEFVTYYRQLEEESQSCIIPDNATDCNINDMSAPGLVHSAWQLYKKKLLEEKNFSAASVSQIEKSTLDILNRLNRGESPEDKRHVKGMVVGNVQSGKTANMGALLSMAADYNWNMFIILTGTIENLRLQTQQRFLDDLCSGNVSWQSFEHPGSNNTSSMSVLDLKSGSRMRYLVCCLKNSRRLEALKRWLNSDINRNKQLRILIIDDEADQASINTKDITEDEKTKINEYLTDIVNDSGQGEFCAMNYVGYTATPYGNFLNDASPESLYPRDFISVLEPSDLYFGPQQIFGSSYNEDMNGLPIICPISGEYRRKKDDATNYDLDVLMDICSSDSAATVEPPPSLKNAIAWFCIAVAIRRGRKNKQACTMLVHHSMVTEHHGKIGRSIVNWLKNVSMDDFIVLCKNVYAEETARFNKEVLKSTLPLYGKKSGIDIDRDIEDYPVFDELVRHIKDLKSTIGHIYLHDANELSYHEGIHICIDNCKYEEVVQNKEFDSYVRLMYPGKEQEGVPYAPAFLVIGGNTLSRGLTLEGLVCTYFSRDCSQADSLMQMGRWFGYRRGYELLPRIWMTDGALKKFQFLSDLDHDLRLNLYRYSTQMTPMDCGPCILNTSGVAMLRLTAKNKSQSAIKAEMSFAGARLQTIYFENDVETLRKNLYVADKFIQSLGSPDDDMMKVHPDKLVWTDIPFDNIWEEFLSQSDYRLSQLPDLGVIKQWIDNLSRNTTLDNWSVVLSGKKNPGNQWNGVGKITRTRKISGTLTPDSKSICIGVLSDPSDWAADIPNVDNLKKEYYSSVESKRDAKEADKEDMKAAVRAMAGKGNVPLLVIYCIDKTSGSGKDYKGQEDGKSYRSPLNAVEDIVGIYIRMPGQMINKDYFTYVTIDLGD